MYSRVSVFGQTYFCGNLWESNRWVANRSACPRKPKSSFTTSAINGPKWARQTFLRSRNVEPFISFAEVPWMVFRMREAEPVCARTRTRLPRSLLPRCSRFDLPIRLSHRRRAVYPCLWMSDTRYDIFAAGWNPFANVFERWTRAIVFGLRVLKSVSILHNYK